MSTRFLWRGDKLLFWLNQYHPLRREHSLPNGSATSRAERCAHSLPRAPPEGPTPSDLPRTPQNPRAFPSPPPTSTPTAGHESGIVLTCSVVQWTWGAHAPPAFIFPDFCFCILHLGHFSYCISILRLYLMLTSICFQVIIHRRVINIEFRLCVSAHARAQVWIRQVMA